jgi:5-methylcytosine-specific restriction protein A
MMKINPASLASILTGQYGLAVGVKAEETSQGLVVDIVPADLHVNDGFLVRAVVGWRSVRAELQIGRFARDFVADLGTATSEMKAQFSALSESVQDVKGRIEFFVNQVRQNPTDWTTWPTDWTEVSLSVERTPLLLDHESRDNLHDAIVVWGGTLLGMIISLSQTEETDLMQHEGLPEGAVQRVEVNKYERSRINRSICVAAHGSKCMGCSFDFGEKYGQLGRGFIHVHHIFPVSKMGGSYVIDPRRDLIPVCANCHAMLHRRDPPLSLDELHDIISAEAS